MSVAKATAAMTAPGPKHNEEAMREGFFKQCEQFGTNAGAGDTSKVGWFQATVEAAWQGIIVPGARRPKGHAGPLNDAERAYTAFADARKRKAGELGRKIQGAQTEDGKPVPGFKQRVNEANTMIKLGSLPLIHDTDMGGYGVFQQALKIIREDDEIKGQTDDMLLDVARRQIELPEAPLTKDQIRQILMPDEPAEKPEREEVELWGIVLRQIESIMNNKFPDTAGTNQDAKTARNSVVRRVDALGGTKAMVKAREKAAEQAKQDKANRQVVRQGARGAKRKKA
jgi:hypothetical protein